MGKLFSVLPWWGQLLAGIAVFAALWGAVHLIQEHWRDQGRAEVQAKWDKKVVEDTRIANQIASARAIADKDAIKQSELLIAAREKVATYETKFSGNLIAQLRGLGGMSNKPTSPDGKSGADVSDLSRCVNVATGAIETAVRNYSTSERNADKLDALQARIETDRATFFKALGVKDPRTPTDAPQRVANRLKELQARAKVISESTPLTRSITQ